MTRGPTPNPYRHGEYDLHHNRYANKVPLPLKQNGVMLKQNGYMQFRPTSRYVGTVPITSSYDEVIVGDYYSPAHQWYIVAYRDNETHTTILLFYDVVSPDVTDTIIARIPIPQSGTLSFSGIKFLSLNVEGNLHGNSIQDSNLILISGAGAPLMCIYRESSGAPAITPFLIDIDGTGYRQTKICIAARVLMGRLYLVLNSPISGIAHIREYLYGSRISVYDDFRTSIPGDKAAAFEIRPILASGEIIYNIVDERKQLLVLTNMGLSVAKALDSDASNLDDDTVAWFNLDRHTARPIGPNIFANYAVYWGDEGLRVRAYSQLYGLYSPSLEPGCEPLPGYYPEFTEDSVTCMANIDSPDSLAIVDNGICYYMAYPRKTPGEQLTALANIYPRTTYLESDVYKVIRVSDGLGHMILQDKKTNKYIIVCPDESMGILTIGAQEYFPELIITKIDNRGTLSFVTFAKKRDSSLPLPQTLYSLYVRYSYIDELDGTLRTRWIKATRCDSETDEWLVRNEGLEIASDVYYKYFPSHTVDMEACLDDLIEINSDAIWAYTGYFNKSRITITKPLDDEKVFFQISEELEGDYPGYELEGDVINNFVFHRDVGKGELVFGSDVPYGYESSISNIDLLFRGSAKAYLQFSPIPKQDMNSGNQKANSHYTLTFPANFNNNNQEITISFIPVLQSIQPDELFIIRFLAS